MSRTTEQDPAINEGPKPKELFCDSTSFRWEEFNTCKAFHNPQQTKVDLSKPKKLWFYLGKRSTEAKAHYTGDLAVRKNDASANFLEDRTDRLYHNCPTFSPTKILPSITSFQSKCYQRRRCEPRHPTSKGANQYLYSLVTDKGAAIPWQIRNL